MLNHLAWSGSWGRGTGGRGRRRGHAALRQADAGGGVGRRRLAALYAGAGLTESQFGVLERCTTSAHSTRASWGGRSSAAAATSPSSSTTWRRAAWCAAPTRDGDRHYVTVHLTDAGRGLIAGLFPRHAANVARELSVLTAAEQEELGRLCRILGRQERP